MKKRTKILSLTAMVAGMITPIALISTNNNNNNNINIDQQINSVDDNETIETNTINSDTATDYKNDDLVVNNAKVESVATITTINFDQCTVEGIKATDWMDITANTGLINFDINDTTSTAAVKSKTANINVSHLKIPSSITYNTKAYNVTSINDDVFNSCSGLTGTLIIPTSVTSIGVSAFRDCSKLTGTLTIPTSVIEIGHGAFFGTKYINVFFFYDDLFNNFRK